MNFGVKFILHLSKWTNETLDFFRITFVSKTIVIKSKIKLIER